MDIYIPGWAKDVGTTRWVCRICDGVFFTRDAHEAHVLSCSKVHENELLEFVEWHNEEHAMPDPEWHAYNESLRKRGIDPDVQFNRRGKKPLKES